MIFVGSMCDLFGSWIPQEWIERVLKTVYKADWHEYMFLTKYPKEYNNYYFPSNCWLGATIEEYNDAGDKRYQDMCEIITDARKYLSIEPILGPFWFVQLEKDFDLIIVGAMTGPGAIKSEKDWLESIDHSNIYLKSNLKNQNHGNKD